MTAKTPARKRPKAPHDITMPANAPEAMLMLAEGHSLEEVGKRFGKRRQTVRAWRERKDCQEIYREALAAREADFRDVALDVRRILRQGAIRAAIQMVQLLDDPAQAAAAARDIMDRIGVLRGEQVTVHNARVDLSNLSTEEIELLEQLQAKAVTG